MSTDEVNGSGVEGGIPVDDVTESDEGLLDSDREEVKGQDKGKEFGYPDEGELDYDELMENEGPEDEVKVHMAEDIEEGEVSSDEEGEIKESDDGGGNEAPPTTLPTTTHTHSVPEYGHSTNTTTTRKGPDKGSPVVPPSQSPRGRDSSSDEGSGRGKGRERQRSGGEGSEKLPTLCRHFLGGKCNWGGNCRFLHENPAALNDRPDRLGGMDDFRGGPPDGPWGIPRGFPPPHFMPGPRPMGHPRDLPPHMDPRGHLPHPPHGRGGFGMHPMHVPFVPMHSRDMGRPFDPMNRGGMERGGQPYPPFPGRDGGRKNEKMAEVTEETDGWMRLRTVTRDWSSEEEGGGRPEGDLRDRIRVRRGGREGDSDSERERRPRSQRGGADDWTDPWARDVKKEKKKRRKASTSGNSSDSDEGEVSPRKRSKVSNSSRQKKEAVVSDSDSGNKSSRKKKKKVKQIKKQSASSENISESEAEKKKKKDVGKKKKKKLREGESSDEETKKKRKKVKHSRHLGSPSSPPPVPRGYEKYAMRNDFYPPPHYPPHMPHPYDLPSVMRPPHGSPVIRPPHVSPKKDQFGRDISKRMEYEDSRRHRRGGDRPPHHDDHAPPHRQPWDPRRWPNPFNEGRRSSEDASGSPTPPAHPEESGSSEEEKNRRKKSKKSKSSDGEKPPLSHKEKLIKELEAINKVIEKKKSKKRSH